MHLEKMLSSFLHPHIGTLIIIYNYFDFFRITSKGYDVWKKLPFVGQDMFRIHIFFLIHQSFSKYIYTILEKEECLYPNFFLKSFEWLIYS